MLKVVLLSHTPEPERLIAAAARNCYSDAGIEDIYDRYEDRSKAAGFVEMLRDLGHESPIEHISFTFAIEGVSRSLLAQLTRHRLASYSVRSQRYINEAGFSYITPPEIASCPEALEVYKDIMEKDAEAYTAIRDVLKKKHEERLISEGMSPKEAGSSADKLANEDARFVLPNACSTQIVMTMNARSLLNFFKQRTCMRAQWEIRELTEKIFMLVYPLAPSVFSGAGPGCVAGKCTEGKMSCGKADEVRKRFALMRGETSSPQIG